MKVGVLLKEKMFQRCDSALLGALLLVAGSVVSKLSSFGLNVYLARRVDPELFGIGFVSIALTTSLSQALNKKCFRRVALSKAADSAGEEAHLQSCVNVCWLSVVSTAVLSLVIGVVWIAHPPSSIALDGQLTRQFRASVVLAGASSVLESLCEPLILSLIQREQVLLRSAIEVLSGTTKSLVLASVAAFKGPKLDMLYYSLGQLVYSSVLLLLTLLAWLRVRLRQPKGLALLPGSLEDRSPPPRGSRFLLDVHRDLLGQHLLSSIQSTVLQETDKMLVLRLFSTKEWSDYGVMANLANTATRVVFAPIEEMAAERFRKVKFEPLLRTGSTKQRLRRQLAPLRELLCLSALIGSLAVCFGPPISRSLLALVFGANRASPANARLLSANMYSLGILSVHGILETFMLSVGGADRISAYRRFCMAVHCMHVSLILLFRHSGCMALVLSNGTAMLLQTLYCLSFVLNTASPAALSDRAPGAKLRLLPELLAKKGSARTLLCLVLGGVAQRGLVRLAEARPAAEKGLRNDVGQLLVSCLLAGFSLALSLPSLLQTLKKLHTD